MKISLNYSELAFIMDLKRQWCMLAFLKILKLRELTGNEEIDIKTLCSLFKPIKSVDPRYDGMNELLFSIHSKRDLYKKELSSKSAIRFKKFTGAKTIFYKICTAEQLEHARTVLEEKSTTKQNKLIFEK